MKVVNKKTGHNTGDRIGNATYNPLILEKSIRPPPPTPQVNVNVNNETSDLDKIIIQLKNMCELTGNSNEIITKQFTLLVDSIKTLKSDMNNMQISKLKNEHVIEINELKSKHKEELEKVIKANAVNKSDSQIKQLEQELTTVKSNKTKVEQELFSANSKLAEIKQELSTANTKLAETKVTVEKLKTELAEAKNNKSKLEQVIIDKSKVEQELIEVKAELTTTNTKLVELKQINSELENDKLNLENVRINLENDKLKLESQVKQLTDLEAQYKFVSSALEEVKKELTKEKENHKHMIEKIEVVHKEEVDKIESELKQQKQQAENDFRQQIEKLKDEFKQQIDQIKESKQQVENKYKEQIEKLKESKQQVENNYKEQIDQLKDGFKLQIDKLKEEKQKAMTSLQVIEAEKKIIDNVNKDLEKRNQQNEIVIKNKETHIDELRLKADRESSELKLKIEKLESQTQSDKQLDVDLIERGLKENLEKHFSTLFSKAKTELTEANEFIKKKVVTVKELIDEFISWFLEKVYNISEMSEQLKEELTNKLTKTNFISFIKDLIKHLKSLFKTRGYTELELAIAEYEDKLNESIPELKVTNEQRAITDDLKAMMTNVLNDIESMKQEINDMKSNELDLAPVVVEQHPQQQSAPVGVRALASSYEALGIDDRVRRLEVEIKFIKAKLDN